MSLGIHEQNTYNFFAILECRITKYTKFKFDPVLAVFFAPLYGKVKKIFLSCQVENFFHQIKPQEIQLQQKRQQMPLFNVVIIIINELASNYLLSRCEVTFDSRVKLLLRIVTCQLSYSQSSPGINQQSSHIILLLLPKIHQFQSHERSVLRRSLRQG